MKERTKKPKKPYYSLVYKYMIGDGNGNTKETVKVSVDNPFLERYVKLLNSLESTKGRWGIVFENGVSYAHVEEGQITSDDLLFLDRLMLEEWDEYDSDSGDDGEGIEADDEERFIVDLKDEKFASEFHEGVEGEQEYSFLVFEGVDLFYYDEQGKKNKTKIK